MDDIGIRYILNYTDSTNPHYKTENFEQRIEGLYLWDKLYFTKKEAKKSEAILHYIQKYKNKNTLDRTTRRIYERLIEGTTNCIESGQYLPLIKNKTNKK